jgi:integrase
MGDVRLGEATTPLVDRVVWRIKQKVSAATAKSCRSVISGVMGLAREARGEDGALAWITSHTFRKTAATILDEASLTGRLIVDQLGHARPSMTRTSTWPGMRSTPARRKRSRQR